jgi:hypothetical protein
MPDYTSVKQALNDANAAIRRAITSIEEAESAEQLNAIPPAGASALHKSMSSPPNTGDRSTLISDGGEPPATGETTRLTGAAREPSTPATPAASTTASGAKDKEPKS